MILLQADLYTSRPSREDADVVRLSHIHKVCHHTFHGLEIMFIIPLTFM